MRMTSLGRRLGYRYNKYELTIQQKMEDLLIVDYGCEDESVRVMFEGRRIHVSGDKGYMLYSVPWRATKVYLLQDIGLFDMAKCMAMETPYRRDLTQKEIEEILTKRMGSEKRAHALTGRIMWQLDYEYDNDPECMANAMWDIMSELQIVPDDVMSGIIDDAAMEYWLILRSLSWAKERMDRASRRIMGEEDE